MGNHELKTNTACIIAIGPFFDKTDGVTLETALTITNEKITLIAETDDGSAPTLILDNVSGATSGTDNDLNYITNNDAGMMQIELSAANLNRYGRMTLIITDAANHVPVFEFINVVSAQFWDAKYGTGNFSADAKAISGDSTAADNLEAACDGNTYNVGGGAIVAASVTTKTGYQLAADQAVNATKFGGTAVTGRDIGASVLISSGSGTGQLDVTSGVIKANLAQILGTALTETAGQIAAGFKKLFDVATPVLTLDAAGMNIIADAVLVRNWASVTYTGTVRCALTALQAVRNKFTAAAGAGGYSVKKEDDSTESWAGTLTIDGDGNITAMDPDS